MNADWKGYQVFETGTKRTTVAKCNINNSLKNSAKFERIMILQTASCIISIMRPETMVL